MEHLPLELMRQIAIRCACCVRYCRVRKRFVVAARVPDVMLLLSKPNLEPNTGEFDITITWVKSHAVFKGVTFRFYLRKHMFSAGKIMVTYDFISEERWKFKSFTLP